MKKILFFLFVMSECIYAQQNKLIELENEIKAINKIDSVLIKKRLAYLGEVYFQDPNRIDILEYAKQTLKFSKEIGYKKGEVLSYQRIGLAFQYFKEDQIKALEAYHQSLQIIDESPKLKYYTPGALCNIGIIYMNQGDNEKALSTFRNIHKNFLESPVIPEQYLAIAFANLKQADSAIYYSKKTIERAKLKKNYVLLANSYSNLSKIQQDNNYLDEAKSNIKVALDLAKENNVGYAISGIYANATSIYLNTKDYNLAELYAQKLLSIPKELKTLTTRRDAQNTLYEVYKNKKEYKKALEAHIAFKKWNDSLTSIDNRVEITKNDLKLESERKELLATTEISKQKAKNRLYLIIGFTVFITFILLLYILNQKRKTQQLLLKENLAKSKLVALKTQLNPHFIFNAMNSINQFIVNKGIDKASSFLIKFSGLMRDILQNSEKDLISLSEELRIMEDYIAIESLRLKYNIIFLLDIDESIDPENTLVPTMFIQPFIENSIEHGISKKQTQGVLKVNILKTNTQELKCTIEDNGIGMGNKKNIENHKSMGIKIIRERMEYINQLTKKKLSFNIKNLQQGVRVTITLPFITEF